MNTFKETMTNILGIHDTGNSNMEANDIVTMIDIGDALESSITGGTDQCTQSGCTGTVIIYDDITEICNECGHMEINDE